MLPRVQVSTRLRISGGEHGEVVRETLQIIDSVHVDGDLPLIEVNFQPPYEYEGRYCSQLKEISLSVASENPHLCVCHEVGHFLDHQGIHPEKAHIEFFRSSEDSAELMRWRTAAISSRPYQELLAIYQQTRDGYVDELLKDREVWARSYAQYIAVKSRDSRLLAQVDAVLTHVDPLENLQQWTLEEFQPIVDSIDELFHKRNWL